MRASTSSMTRRCWPRWPARAPRRARSARLDLEQQAHLRAVLPHAALVDGGAGAEDVHPADVAQRLGSLPQCLLGRCVPAAIGDTLELDGVQDGHALSLIHISEPTRRTPISYAV